MERRVRYTRLHRQSSIATFVSLKRSMSLSRTLLFTLSSYANLWLVAR